MSGIAPLHCQAIGAALIVVATSAMAATDDLESHFKVFSAPRVEQNVRKHANCIAGHYAPEVQLILRNDWGMQEITSDHKNLLDFKCTTAALFHDNSTTLSDLNYPQALAEAMLIKDYNAKIVSDVDLAVPLKRDEVPILDDHKLSPKFRNALALSKYFQDLDEISECTARKKPQDVFAIFKTALNSQEEATALQTINPALAECGMPRLLPPPPAYYIRGALAKNLYRLADELHPVDEPPGTEH